MLHERDVERVLAQTETELPGASRGALKGMLYDVIDEFMNDSNFWIEHIALTIQPGTQDYQLIPQRGGKIVRLVAIFDQNFINYPARVKELDPPNAFIRLVWPQNQVIAAQVVVTKSVVTTTRDDLPDAPARTLSLYGRYIKYGMLGRMMAQPNKTYTNLAGAKLNMIQFRDAITIVRTEVARSQLYGGQSWRYPGNFRVNSQRGGVSTPFPTPSGQGI